MDVILTHEHSDFDAAAAQLGAARLMAGATPVLAQRLHRNVEQFVTLYRDELPFVSRADLPRQRIDHAIVVDTQHFQTVRGMTSATTIQIIDHHPPGGSLKPEWQVSIDEVGATSTLMTERIREGGVTLSSIEATMLMLGIYEDTGSLTYHTTTPRDIFAAGWLMEHGALMEIVREYLHFPLTDGQRRLYDRLIQNAEVLEIGGYPVILSAADGRDLEGEISALAHRLRDVYDVRAIFLLVELVGHIQLVARSTVEQIDVNTIAAAFGGGGHSRAAAAVIKDMTLEATLQSLRSRLPTLVQPPLTVSDLMSYGVQTLSPVTTAQEADQRMRRYGYEGFPIVRNGLII
ncbi:MAG: DHH family phosphoesterase, partial [Anaerolineae bacterium]|nr:DHH family phosphoesterase [Anaerolineae bacterium]